jgi:hypothetical protein
MQISRQVLVLRSSPASVRRLPFFPTPPNGTAIHPRSQDLALIHKSENEPEKPIGKAEFFWELNSAKALGEPLPL